MPRFFDSIRFALRFSLRSFTDQSVNALLVARKHAVERRFSDITPEHVLFGIAALPRCTARVVLENIGLDLVREAMAVTDLADSYSPGESYASPRLAAGTEQLLGRAKEQARALGLNYVGTEHLVLGMLGGSGQAADYLRDQGITPERFLAELQDLFAVPPKPPNSDQPTE
ncbi:MAG: Clp protease N-terminal domain-containing protein [Isosphaerales bacterium]